MGVQEQEARHGNRAARCSLSKQCSQPQEIFYAIINVFQAIRHAVDKWKVHIIAMSFGFEIEQNSPIEEHSILKSIRYAGSKGVAMFAAASNDWKKSSRTRLMASQSIRGYLHSFGKWRWPGSLFLLNVNSLLRFLEPRVSGKSALISAIDL